MDMPKRCELDQDDEKTFSLRTAAIQRACSGSSRCFSSTVTSSLEVHRKRTLNKQQPPGCWRTTIDDEDKQGVRLHAFRTMAFILTTVDDAKLHG